MYIGNVTDADVFEYTACPDVLHKNLELVYMIFFYTPGVQYLILTRFHVKHKQHDLYKKNMIYIRKTIKKTIIFCTYA